MTELKDMEAISIVSNLNEHLFESIGHGNNLAFSFYSSGYQSLIYFEEVVLWDSDNDEREFKDGDYEDLEKYVKKQFKSLCNKLQVASKSM